MTLKPDNHYELCLAGFQKKSEGESETLNLPSILKVADHLLCRLISCKKNYTSQFRFWQPNSLFIKKDVCSAFGSLLLLSICLPRTPLTAAAGFKT